MEELWDNKESMGRKFLEGIKFVTEVIKNIFRGGKWNSEMMDTPKPDWPKPSSPSGYVIPESDGRF